MNTFECEVYMFGENHTVFIETDYTLEELQDDWGLKEALVTEAVLSKINVQNKLEQI